MPILREIVYGRTSIGVYLAMNNDYFLYPPKINPKLVSFIKQIHPEMTTIETTIAGSSVIGSFLALNSYGMVVPEIIHDDEIALLLQNMKKDFLITKIDIEDNAFGNLILCNDKGAIISPKLADVKEIIQKALKVPVRVLKFANSELPGSCGLANNFGVVVHPLILEDDAEIIAKWLQVEIDVSTVNCGSPFLGGGAIVNDYEAIFGRDSTGPELNRVMEILNLK